VWPRRHRFAYRLFYLALDLDELEAVHASHRLLSVNRGNLFSIREADYLPEENPVQESTLKQRVLRHCAAQGLVLDNSSRVTLLTLPRILGHAFNPVSFHVVHDAQGSLRCVIAEVTNTFHERKCFFLARSAPASEPGRCSARLPKLFYVSPFSKLDDEFDFEVQDPGEDLSIRIDDHEAGQLRLHSSLKGRAEALGDARLLVCLLRFPAVSLRVLTLIHWQALRLWLRRIPYFRKADRPDLQQDVRNPHSTLNRHSLA